VPPYEYACKKCGQHLEVQQSFTDASLTECPNCRGPLRKVFGNIAITFKGSGFYKTDSRTSTSAKSSDKSSEKGSDTTAAASDKPASESSKPADTKSGAGAKTEKPAKAPEAKAS
jgi:putative FmdB family regulatory protein